MSRPPPRPRVLIYILRRDVRLCDNPAFHRASVSLLNKEAKSNSDKGTSLESDDGTPNFTHLLPVYVFPANQVELSGFLSSPSDQSPYPEARSQIANVWRTGPHRAKFMAEGVWDLKENIEQLNCGSSLIIRVGMIDEVVEHILTWLSEDDVDGAGKRAEIAGIWMTAEEGTEEKNDEREVEAIAGQRGVDFRLLDDEKYYIDDRDLPFQEVADLPNVYTTFRKSMEPLRSRPRSALPTPAQLPPLPPDIPPQKDPFEIPTTLPSLIDALLSPLNADPTFGLPSPPRWPDKTQSAHPFEGGETPGQERLSHLVQSGAMSSYKETRNGMLGLDFSTKLSAYLAQGHLTARQVHWAMVDFEEGRGAGKGVEEYGSGENTGTAAVRFELLWRDYMRLCARKFGAKMFDVDGIRDYPEGPNHPPRKRWRYIDARSGAGDDPAKTLEAFTRFRSGRTGTGLIDASNRELFLTGYTSNRARQNVASFLASHLGIDWRIGAEWYESFLTDYDVGNNWGNWQYVAGVGNDPRQGRVFNPVKQALDYDGQGEYVKAWVPELRDIRLTKEVGSSKEEIDQHRLMGLYQAWRLSDLEKEKLGLRGVEWVEHPLIRIQFSVGKGRGGDGGGQGRGRGGSRGRGKDRGFRRFGNEDRAGKAQDPAVHGGHG